MRNPDDLLSLCRDKLDEEEIQSVGWPKESPIVKHQGDCFDAMDLPGSYMHEEQPPTNLLELLLNMDS